MYSGSSIRYPYSNNKNRYRVPTGYVSVSILGTPPLVPNTEGIYSTVQLKEYTVHACMHAHEKPKQ